DDMRAALQQARDDDRVKAIVLEVDSPGGEVTASDAIYSALVKARARKPVVIYMDSLAASGGYYVSCGGKFLMASETTITGSIGVIIQTLNYEQLFNKVGLASVVFKIVKYGPPFSLSRFFRIFGQADSKIELQLPKQLIPQLETGRAYFLPSYYAP